MGAVEIVIGIVGLIISSLIGNQLNQQNIAKNNALMIEQQQQARQDAANAIQTRAKDLKAAGLSKTLAAGSAAQVIPPVQTEAPKVDVSSIEGLFQNLPQTMSNMAKQRQDISQSKAQMDLIQTQMDLNRANTYKTFVDASKTGVEESQLTRNLELAKTTGISSDKASMFGKAVNEVWNMWNQAKGETRGRDLKAQDAVHKTETKLKKTGGYSTQGGW